MCVCVCVCVCVCQPGLNVRRYCPVCHNADRVSSSIYVQTQEWSCVCVRVCVVCVCVSSFGCKEQPVRAVSSESMPHLSRQQAVGPPSSPDLHYCTLFLRRHGSLLPSMREASLPVWVCEGLCIYPFCCSIFGGARSQWVLILNSSLDLENHICFI